MLRVVVEDPEILFLAHDPDVFNDVVKRFERPVELCGDDVQDRIAIFLEQAQRPCESRREKGLRIFSWQKNKRLFVEPFVRPLVVNPCQIRSAELLPRLKKIRLPAGRAFDVYECGFDDLDHELRRLWFKFVPRIVQDSQKPLSRLDPVLIRNRLAVDHILRVLLHAVDNLSCHL